MQVTHLKYTSQRIFIICTDGFLLYAQSCVIITTFNFRIFSLSQKGALCPLAIAHPNPLLWFPVTTKRCSVSIDFPILDFHMNGIV